MQPSQGLNVESHQAIRVVVPMRKDHTDRASCRRGWFPESLLGGKHAACQILNRVSNSSPSPREIRGARMGEQHCFREDVVAETRTDSPSVHFVGSIPLPDAETVVRRLTEATGPYLQRLPDGETGIRKTWIRFLQLVLADNPAIEVPTDVPPFKFTQWDGKLLREIPRLRVKPGATPDPATFETGYADMAIASWKLFERLQRDGVIPAGVKFQISLPTPIAPTY